MPVSLEFNGTDYLMPLVGDSGGWGQPVSAWFADVSANALTLTSLSTGVPTVTVGAGGLIVTGNTTTATLNVSGSTTLAAASSTALTVTGLSTLAAVTASGTVTVPVAANPTDAVQKTYVDTATSTGLILRGYLAGCNISVASSTTFTVSAGQAMSDDNTVMMTLGSGLTKSTAGTWIVGNNQNGIDTGAIAVGAWYHVFVIYNPTSLVTDVLFSLSATTPTMPTGYTKQRRIGSLRAGASAILFPIFQNGDRFDFNQQISVLAGTSYGNTTANTQNLFVPTGVVVEAMTSAAIFDSVNSTTSVYVSSLVQSDILAGVTTGVTALTSGVNGTFGMWSELHTVTNTSGNVRIRCTSASTALYLNSTGYIDTRGRFA